MDWLVKLPVVGPLMERLMRTHAWRVYERLETVHWARLAAAITFLSFLAVFPLITVAAAVGAALLPESQLNQLQDLLSQQVPVLAEQLDLKALVDNAGTVGLIAGALLLFTGISWVSSLRECLRAVWQKEEDPGSPLLLKAKDAGALFGLGLLGALAMGGSAFASSAVGRVAELIGLKEGGIGTVLLFLAGLAVAVGANFVLLAYLLTRLPQVRPTRRAVVIASLIGAVGFELLKMLLSGYIQGIAAKSMYGAFGVPVALLVWMSFMAKLLLVCSAWTATEAEQAAPSDEENHSESATTGPEPADVLAAKP
ncbi:YihY/virulence factor BrkB family protein [Streptomyces sp. NPDC058534]|uniref:YihY/virulence factor BrkB family protein n=1 Tax=Streptomyces sp. NPDC058534 TaxID=3346541 RepID=UPI003647B7E0